MSRREFLILATIVVVWSATMVGAGFYAFRVASDSAESLALHEARTLFLTITDFRRWASQHGGVYVWTSEKVKPNPYLPADRRTIRDEHGRELTLINPSLMTRQAAELIGERRAGVAVHLTSLRPIRPKNAPHAWERPILERFEHEGGTYSGFAGEHEFRFMAPLKTDKSCISCHTKEASGSVRGGVSITIEAGPFVQARETQQRNAAAVLALVWLLGMIIVAFFARVFRRGEQRLIEAEEESCQDPLTALRNRRGFLRAAEQALAAADGARDRAVLLFMDVDFFKELNDLHGHTEGDLALQRIAGLLLETFRDTDIICRLGGDEFVVLMLHADEEECAKAQQRLEVALDRSNDKVHKRYELALSVGTVAFRPSEGMVLDQLLEDADKAMYSEKRRRRASSGHTAVGRHSA